MKTPDTAGGVVLMTPIGLEWSLDIPDGFVRSHQTSILDQPARNRFCEGAGAELDWTFPAVEDSSKEVWLETTGSIGAHHTLNPIFAAACSRPESKTPSGPHAKWLVFPMGVAIVSLEFPMDSPGDARENPDPEGVITSWWSEYQADSELDAQEALTLEAKGAKAHLDGIGSSLSGWKPVTNVNLVKGLAWIHTLRWLAGPGNTVEIRSGSSFLTVEPDPDEENGSSVLMSSVDTLALGQALWYFEDMADTESVLRTLSLVDSERMRDFHIAEEKTWTYQVRSVPGLVSSIATSLPPAPLTVWKQLTIAWDMGELRSTLSAKVDEYDGFLTSQSRANQARREKTAEMILAVVAISALASLIGDIAAQLTDDPIEFLGVSNTRWPVIILMFFVLGLAYLLLKRSSD